MKGDGKMRGHFYHARNRTDEDMTKTDFARGEETHFHS